MTWHAVHNLIRWAVGQSCSRVSQQQNSSARQSSYEQTNRKQLSLDDTQRRVNWSGHQGCRVLDFCGTPTPELENWGLQTLIWTPALKNLDSDSRPKIRLRLQLCDLLCDIMIVYLRMTWEKFLNSSNKRCTIVYKQKF